MAPESRLPTRVATVSSGAGARIPPSTVIGRLRDSFDPSGYAPGVVLGDRYRIIGLIGQGGMGEVYRADDLKLGHPVALKFLPEAMTGDPAWIERFYAEVRHARQISHPNVCRVYDVAEVDGRHFLSMEYIDGEDLASLLRRIGRLPMPGRHGSNPPRRLAAPRSAWKRRDTADESCRSKRSGRGIVERAPARKKRPVAGESPSSSHRL